METWRDWSGAVTVKFRITDCALEGRGLSHVSWTHCEASCRGTWVTNVSQEPLLGALSRKVCSGVCAGLSCPGLQG